jgi:hypothetical protein
VNDLSERRDALGIAYVRQERRYRGLAKPAAKELDRLSARVLRGGAIDAPQLPAHLRATENRSRNQRSKRGSHGSNQSQSPTA